MEHLRSAQLRRLILNSGVFQHPVRVLQDVEAMLTVAPHLEPILINDTSQGVVQRFFQLNGTIPIYFKSLYYNIPVIISLNGLYPTSPPRIQLHPTPSMKLVGGHHHVNNQGLVTTSTITNWTPSNTMAGLIKELCALFSEQPPVVAVQSANPIQPLLQKSPPNVHTVHVDEDSNLLEHKLAHHRSDAVSGISDGLAEQLKLQNELNAELEKMVQIRDGLQQRICMIKDDKDKIADASLHANKYIENANDTKVIEPSMIQILDSDSSEILNSLASDLAHGDVVRTFEEAFRLGMIYNDLYLEGVRESYRQQYVMRRLWKQAVERKREGVVCLVPKEIGKPESPVQTIIDDAAFQVTMEPEIMREDTLTLVKDVTKVQRTASRSQLKVALPG